MTWRRNDTDTGWTKPVGDGSIDLDLYDDEMVDYPPLVDAHTIQARHGFVERFGIVADGKGSPDYVEVVDMAGATIRFLPTAPPPEPRHIAYLIAPVYEFADGATVRLSVELNPTAARVYTFDVGPELVARIDVTPPPAATAEAGQ